MSGRTLIKLPLVLKMLIAGELHQDLWHQSNLREGAAIIDQ